MSPHKKVLEANRTMRKSVPSKAPRRTFNHADPKLVYHNSIATEKPVSNGHSSFTPVLQRPPDQILSDPDSPSRKRRRTFSPRRDNSALDLPPTASPLAFPSALYNQNGGSHIPDAPRLPILGADLHPFSGKVHEKHTSLGNFFRPPHVDHRKTQSSKTDRGLDGVGSLIPNGGLNGNSRVVERLPSVDRVESIVKHVSKKPSVEITPPVQALASNVSSPRMTVNKVKEFHPKKPSTHDFEAPIDGSQLAAVARKQPTLANKATDHLDAFIYAQQNSTQQPPSGVNIKLAKQPKQLENVVYAHIDPRTHHSRPHSEAWYQQKQAEIKARGGRLANLNKAAHRMKEQRLKDDPDDFEANLPDRVRNNEDWVTALRWFNNRNHGTDLPKASTPETPPLKAKRSYKKRQTNSQPTPERTGSAQVP